MKSRTRLRTTLRAPLRLSPLLVLLALGTGNSYGVIPLLPSHFANTEIFRIPAVVDDEKDEYVTKADNIIEENSIDIEQKSIDEASDEVMVLIEGGMPKVALSAEDEEKEEEGEKEVSKVDSADNPSEDKVVCETEDTKESTPATEIEKISIQVMNQFSEFMKTAFIPMYMNYLATKSFKAPEVYTGFAGVPASNQNFGSGLGLNLLSLSDYFNTRSLGIASPFTQNVYNISGDFHMGSAMSPMQAPSTNFNMASINNNSFVTPEPGFIQTANTFPSFNFNSASIHNQSRFDQMNAQNIAPASATVTPPVSLNSKMINTAPRSNIALPSMINTIGE